MAGRRWIIRATIVFSILLGGWIATAFVINASAAGNLPISMLIYTNLKADYSVEKVAYPLGVFSFSIISDTLEDRGLSSQEVEERTEALEIAMSNPVPTATARNYRGGAPFTATPTFTLTPTKTPSPTKTPTYTPTKVPTKTPTKTPTPKPTQKPKPSNTPTKEGVCPSPCPTDTSIPATDTKKPNINDFSLSPPPGPVGSCELRIEVDNLHIVDPPYSSGIDWILLKYYDEVRKEWVRVRLDPEYPVDWTLGDAWNDKYDLSISMVIGAGGGVSLDTLDGGRLGGGNAMLLPVTCDRNIELIVRVQDNAGNVTELELGTYILPEACFGEGD